jgi:DNA-binding NtrC family response regulator
MKRQTGRAGGGGGKSVLVVDDDRGIQRILLRELRRSGYLAEACGTLSGALGRLASQHFDLVLLDLKLPDVTGDAGIRRVRSDYPDCEVVVITGRPDADSAFVSGQLGVTQYVKKPFGLADLMSVVRQTVGSAAACEAVDSPSDDPTATVPTMSEAVDQQVSALLVVGETGTCEAPAVMERGASDTGELPQLPSVTQSSRLKAYERVAIERALEEARGNVALAARSEGVSRATFYRKMADHGIDAKRLAKGPSSGPTHGESGSGHSQV